MSYKGKSHLSGAVILFEYQADWKITSLTIPSIGEDMSLWNFYTPLPDCKRAQSLWEAIWMEKSENAHPCDPVLGLFTNIPALLSFQAHSRMACPHVFEVTQRPMTRFGQCNVNRRNGCHCQVEVPRASIRFIKLLSLYHGDHRGIRNGAIIRPSWSADNEKRPLQTHTGYTAWERNKRSPLRCLLLQHHLAHLGRYAQQAHS